jgi:hypothetical protein
MPPQTRLALAAALGALGLGLGLVTALARDEGGPAAVVVRREDVSVPRVTASSSPAASRLPAACFPAALAEAALLSTRLEGASLTVCLDGRDPLTDPPYEHPCLDLDLATREVHAAAPAPEPDDARFEPPGPPSSKYSVWATATEIAVCGDNAEACQTVHVEGPAATYVGHADDETDALIAAANEDGQRLAVLVAERVPSVPEDYANSHRVFVETYAVASGRRLSRTPVRPYAGSPFGIFSNAGDYWGVRWLGARLWLSAHRCCGPDGVQAIFDPATGAIDYLGEPLLWHVVADGTWLIGREEPGEGEGAPGTVSLTFYRPGIARRTTLRLPARPRPIPETFVLASHPVGENALVVVHANPPGVAWVDLRREALSAQLSLPLCPP